MDSKQYKIIKSDNLLQDLTSLYKSNLSDIIIKLNSLGLIVEYIDDSTISIKYDSLDIFKLIIFNYNLNKKYIESNLTKEMMLELYRHNKYSLN